MQLTALSCGYAIPQADFDATIHSVFENVVNLRPADSDLLLTLVAAGEADLPQGMRLDTPCGLSFEQLSAGKGIDCRGGSLIFENSSLTVDLRQARRWRCNLPALGTDLAEPATAQAWKSTWKVLNELQTRLGVEIVAQALPYSDRISQSAVSRRAGKAICILVDDTHRYRLDDLSILVNLIGLGSGLTPSGDDFLVGYLAGLWCAVRDSVERRHFVDKLGQAVIQLSEQTNDISRTYLFHAAHGQVSGRLEALARAISRGESPEQILPVAEFAMDSGHTSGMEAVTGLLFGLAAWEGEKTLLAG